MRTERGQRRKKPLVYPGEITGRVVWMRKRFPDFEVAEHLVPYLVNAEANTPIDSEDAEQFVFMLVEDSQHLIDLKPIIDEILLSDWEYLWPLIQNDIKSGEKFAFYWNHNGLAWYP